MFRTVPLTVILLLALSPLSPARADLDLSSAVIVCGPNAPSQERFAALELQRYLYRLTGKTPAIASEINGRKTAVAIGTPASSPLIRRFAKGLSLSERSVGEEGCHMKAFRRGEGRVLAVAARKPVGVLYGIYGLLEKLGMGFYLGGDTFPARGPVKVPDDLDEVCKPVFRVRGSLPWYNFLDSPTTWDPADYRYFFEQMAKQRFNFVGFHTYDSEPFVPASVGGEPLAYAQPLASSLTYGWGAVRGLKTRDFGFGTGDYFDRDPFASRSLLDASGPRAQIERSCRLLAEALAYARGLGIKSCVGFELTGDPTDPETLARLESRIKSLLILYPMLDYVWFWQSEGLGGGNDLPAEDSPMGLLARKEGAAFAYLGDPRRIAEAARVSRYAQVAYRILKSQAPDKKMILSGWGGDRWMRFSDFCEGLDKTLPEDIIFAALDNIDPTSEPNVSAVYGRLSPHREKWPIPWWESDGGGTRRDQWAPQSNTRPFAALCRDAFKKKCQGMLAIHWRTRDVEEVAGYQARFAWNPALTYERYYADFARQCYGPEWTGRMSRIHRQLESLGSRWTGALGQTECGAFGWFDENRLPSEANSKTLRTIRAELRRVEEEMAASRKTGGLERVRWLSATIDWLLRYDAAATRLRPEGDIARLVAEAEAAKAARNPAAAAKGAAAYRALLGSGLREAMQTYPRKMTTRGEWGTLATINVKAYAAFLQLVERVRRVNPSLSPLPAESPCARESKPFIVMHNPGTTAQPGRSLTVQAVVTGGTPIRSVALRLRQPGNAKWDTVPMRRHFRSVYRAVLPSNAVTIKGLEYYIEAEDSRGRKAVAPAGFPAAAWSLTGMIPSAPKPPLTPPAAFIPAAPPALKAEVTGDYEVTISWREPTRNRGCRYEIYREETPDFKLLAGYRLATTYLPPVYDLADRGNAIYTYTVIPVSPTGRKGPAARVTLHVPTPPIPDAPPGLRAASGAGKVRLTWEPAGRANLRYRIYRAEEGSEEFRRIAEVKPVRGPVFQDAGISPDTAYRYRVTAVDRGGQESAPGEAVIARPLPAIYGPVFHARFDGSAAAELAPGIDPAAGQGTLESPATYGEGAVGPALDTRNGGYAVFPYNPAFDIDGAFTITCRVKLDTLTPMPVIASCGEWTKNGWFLQIIGGSVRFYIGGNNVLDAGRPQSGRWMRLAAVFDGQEVALYLNGQEAGRKPVSGLDDTSWGRPLYIGHYHYLQEPYQTHGLIDEFKLYQRALSAEEIAGE
ncbi:MAG: hypothetical protein IT210_00445 [Armatimonadetes bacterium]|nr:hypothetical protein [Armatimonadota bacterium]